jgi:hypothetical protein
VASPPARVYLEFAHRMGIETFFTWHSVVTQNLKFDALGCDDRAPSVVTTCLTWGRANEEWLAKIGAKVRYTRTGTLLPVARHRPVRGPAAGQELARAVVLQHNQVLVDPKAYTATQFTYFVEVVRLLMKLGCGEIRYKLHPGIWSVSYHEEIARRFGLRCEILKSEPLEPLIDWCDFAVGPVTTGAMHEFLAAGKPYYGMLLPPHAIDLEYFRNVRVLASVAELEDALLRRQSIDAEVLLEDFCACSQIPAPPRAVWRVLEEAALTRRVPGSR